MSKKPKVVIRNIKRKSHPTQKVVIAKADVDKGIVPVVEWINGFEGVITRHSCQGHCKTERSKGTQPYVSFTCHNELSLLSILHQVSNYSISVEVRLKSGVAPLHYRMDFGNSRNEKNLATDGQRTLKMLIESLEKAGRSD